MIGDEPIFPETARHFKFNSPGFGLTKRELFSAIFMHSHIVANLGHSVEMCSAQDLAKGAIVSADALIAELAKEK